MAGEPGQRGEREREVFIAMSAWWIRHVLFVGCTAGEFALIIFPSTDTRKSMWHRRAREKCERVEEEGEEKKRKSRNLGRTGGATAPPSCQKDEIRTGSNAEDSAMRNIHPPLLTPVITLLQANMSSLHCDFSYADVPSAVFLSWFCQKKGAYYSLYWSFSDLFSARFPFTFPKRQK